MILICETQRNKNLTPFLQHQIYPPTGDIAVRQHLVRVEYQQGGGGHKLIHGVRVGLNQEGGVWHA